MTNTPTNEIKLSPAKRAIRRHLAKLQADDRLLTIKFAPPSATCRKQQRLMKLEALQTRADALAAAEVEANAPVRAVQHAQGERRRLIAQAATQAARAVTIKAEVAAATRRGVAGQTARQKWDAEFKVLHAKEVLTEEESAKKIEFGKKADDGFFEMDFARMTLEELAAEQAAQKEIQIPPEPTHIEPTYDHTAWEAMRTELQAIIGSDTSSDNVHNLVRSQVTRTKSADIDDYECPAITQLWECGLTPWLIETAPDDDDDNALVAWFCLDKPLEGEAIASMLPEGATIESAMPFDQAYSRAPIYVGMLDAAGTRTKQLPTLPVPSTPAEWAAYDAGDAEYLLGKVLSTTSRWLMSAEKGIGKSMLSVAMGMRIARGDGFFHWAGSGKAAKVLYIDGEMSRRLLQRRIADELKRVGKDNIPTFIGRNRDHIENFGYLNTTAGQKAIDDIIELKMDGHADLIIFDNIQALLSGNKATEEAWAGVDDWSKKITAEGTAQIWVHHMSPEGKRGYGSVVKEWGMDAVILLFRTAPKGVSFEFQFAPGTARELMPETAEQFNDVKIKLGDDGQWHSNTVAARGLRTKLSATQEEFYKVLAQASGGNAISRKAWFAACIEAKMLEAGDNPKRLGTSSARALFSKHCKSLIDRGWVVALEDDLVAVVVEREI